MNTFGIMLGQYGLAERIETVPTLDPAISAVAGADERRTKGLAEEQVETPPDTAAGLSGDTTATGP